jgi:hypothetical protein
MKKLLFLFLALCVTTSAMAFSFDVPVIYENKYVYFSQIGKNSLFGNIDTAQSSIGSGQTTIGFPGPVNGVLLTEGLSSKGSDGSFWIQRLVLWPKFIVNQAVRVNSEVGFSGDLNGQYVGGSNWLNTQPYAGYIRLSSRTLEPENAIAVPGVRSLWVDADIPWGKISIGRTPFQFGLGWTIGDYRADFVRLVVPYGPLSFLTAVVLSDTGEFSSRGDTRNKDRTPLTVASTFDRTEQKQLDVYAGLIYRDGSADIGFLARSQAWRGVHATPFTTWTLRDDVNGAAFAMLSEGVISGGAGSDGTDLQNFPIHSDIFFHTLSAYLKYMRGGFFFNGEFGYQKISVVRTGGRQISGTPLAWMVEMGTIAGPLKTTLVHFYSSGHQTSNGTLNFAAATGTSTGRPVDDKFQLYTVSGNRWQAVDPYAFVLPFFGTGNNSYNASGYPVFYDYLGLGIRLDYAIASNLNLFGTFLYSRRASNNSTIWGQYGGGISSAPTIAPVVADNFLGNSIGCGLQWKLLEALTFGMRMEWWKPGQWFKHAFQDLSTLNTIPNPLSTGQGEGVRIDPNRDLSTIFGLQGSVLVEF